MTRARQTSQLQSATNYDGSSGADDFAIIDTSVRLVNSDITLNSGANDALVSINKTHVRIDDGYTLDIAGDRHLIINHYNLPHTVV